MSGQKSNKRTATCHPNKSHLARGLCSSCYYKEPDIAPKRKQDRNKWVAKNHERVKTLRRRYYLKNRTKILAVNKVRRQWCLYQISQEQYNKMFEAQHGLCAICLEPPKSQGLNIDHDHMTNRVRGLLCWFCNKYIVCGPNTPEMLKRAINYLESVFDGRTL